MYGCWRPQRLCGLRGRLRQVSRSAGAIRKACLHANPVGQLIAFRVGHQISWSLGLCMCACKSCRRVDCFSIQSSDQLEPCLVFAFVHANPAGDLIAFRVSPQISWSLGLCMRACNSCWRVDRFWSQSSDQLGPWTLHACLQILLAS